MLNAINDDVRIHVACQSIVSSQLEGSNSMPDQHNICHDHVKKI